MKIAKLNLKNFKGIKQASINFGDITIITGKNSSGKSSLIQAIKYFTQWLKRVERTRDMNAFSVPSFQVFHQDFITENQRYDAVKNSSSKEGVGLGIEWIDYIPNANDLPSRSTLQINLEKAARLGELVRLKTLKIWEETILEDEFDTEMENFNVIYNDEEDEKLRNQRRKYIEAYALGSFFPDNTRKVSKEYRGEDYIATSKDSSLQHIWNKGLLDDGILEEIRKICETELGDEREEALVLNTNGERISFSPRSILQLTRSRGFENFYLDYFFDYIDRSENAYQSKQLNYPFDTFSDFDLGSSFKAVAKIYQEGYEKILVDYLNHDLALLDDKLDDYDDFSPTYDPKIKPPYFEGIYYPYIEQFKEDISKECFKDFVTLTKLINGTSKIHSKPKEGSEARLVTVQAMLMFIDFINRLVKSKLSPNISNYVEEIVSDNDILTVNGVAEFKKEAVVNSISDLQIILAESSKFIGIPLSEKKSIESQINYDTFTCDCLFALYNHPLEDDLTINSDLKNNEVVKPCPYNPVVEHIYELTTKEEIESFEPNNYTLYPHVKFRGYANAGTTLLRYYIKEFFSNNNSTETFGFFANLLQEVSDGRRFTKEYVEYTESSLELKELEKRINDIQDRRISLEEERHTMEASLKVLEDDFPKFKRLLSLPQSSEERNDLNLELRQNEERQRIVRENLDYVRDKLNIIQRDYLKLMKSYEKAEKMKKYSLTPMERQRFAKINSILNSNYIPHAEDNIFTQANTPDLLGLSLDIKYLNNGRNPSQQESPGAFYDNLTVGKYGGLLAELIFNEAEREVYPFVYPSSKTTPPFDRSFEELDWHTLPQGDMTFLSAFNHWISYLEMEISEIKSEMDGPRPEIKVSGKDDKSRNVFEVGSGIGQVLPVIAICLLAKPGEVVCIEEPESNLHPSAQAYLADFLLAMAASGRQLIIETHSPNIIDRLRLRKAHKSWNKLKNYDWTKNSLNLDGVDDIAKYFGNFVEPDVQIIFAEQNQEGESSYNSAVIDKLGDIIFEGSEMNPWPKGFFDNTQDELSNILKARIYSEEE